MRTQGGSPWSSTLFTSDSGSTGGCLFRQRNSNNLSLAPRGHHVSCSKQGGPVTLTLGGADGDFSNASIHPGSAQYSSRLSVQEEPGHRFGVDRTSADSGLSTTSLAGHSRSVCDLGQLSPSVLLFSSPGSHEHGNRRSPILGQPAGICFSPVIPAAPGAEQDPFWPEMEWFPDLLESLVDPPLRLPERRDLLIQPHFHRFHLGLQSLRLHAWRLSNGLPGMKDSLLKWLNSYSLVEGIPLM